MAEAKTACRICPGACSMVAKLEDGRIASLRGDKDSPLTHGYACMRGLNAVEGMYHPERILRPLKRQPDGTFTEIGLETALDEIAAKLGRILAESGGDAVGIFKGTQLRRSFIAHDLLDDWLKAIGSTRHFTTITIDQSCKQITMLRMGAWKAGKPKLDDCDVMMVFGGNALVTNSTFNFFYDPARRLKAALKRGLKIIVVDPRLTEIAQSAHHFLQCKPGEDVTIAAGMIRSILTNGWHDPEFCARHVKDLDRLRAAVEPFTPDYVARRAGIPADELQAAVETFALRNKRGVAVCGTGPSMSPHSNLADHMVECLNVICGRYYREGDRIPNPGVLRRAPAPRAEVTPPFREWEQDGPRTESGHGTLMGQLMSGVLADEMLRTDSGRLRAFFAAGGNPAAALPDQRKVVAAMRSLDLMVVTDPFMTTTAKLAHYIIPPTMMYERPDWALCSRLGIPLSYRGVSLDMTIPPTNEYLYELLLQDSKVGLDEIMRHPGGAVFDIPPVHVLPASGPATPRFDVMPDDVWDELAEVRGEAVDEGAGGTGFLLITRRLRGVMNSLGILQEQIRRKHPYNSAYMHPADMARLGLCEGAAIEIASDLSAIGAIVEGDDTLRPGTVAMSHCWGGLPDEGLPIEALGVSTNLLVRTDCFVEKINAMPRYSSIPVTISPVAAKPV